MNKGIESQPLKLPMRLKSNTHEQRGQLVLPKLKQGQREGSESSSEFRKGLSMNYLKNTHSSKVRQSLQLQKNMLPL